MVSYANGQPAPPRAYCERQDRLMGTADVAAELGYAAANSVVTALYRRHFHLVPPPDGRVGQVMYWHCDQFDEWKEHNRANARVRATATGRA
jgi:hypothetical protein